MNKEYKKGMTFEEYTNAEQKVLIHEPELLLHPNIPKPLHGLNPRTIRGAKWWNIHRREAYAANNYHCWACSKYAPYDHDKKRFISEKLDAHEYYDINYKEKTAKLKKIVALCKHCHATIHSGRLQAMFDIGENDIQWLWELSRHSQNILKKPLKIDTRDYRQEWNDWRLIIDGVEYKSKFKNMEEWEAEYGR